MRQDALRSGYMPLTGSAPVPSVGDQLVSCQRHRWIFLATFHGPSAAFPQFICPFHATRRRNLGLAEVLAEEREDAPPDAGCRGRDVAHPQDTGHNAAAAVVIIQE